MIGWLVHVSGIEDMSGRWYAFWSGIGSDLGEFGIIWGLFAHYKRNACHVDSPRFCWRPGTHPVAGTPYRTCKKHHPDVPARVSADYIREAGS